MKHGNKILAQIWVLQSMISDEDVDISGLTCAAMGDADI
jgi:hypothetical protein